MAPQPTMTAFFVAFAATLTATPAVIALVHRWQLIDVPNQRSSHVSPVPRGGGIAILLATVTATAVASDWSRSLVGLLVGAVVLGIIGLLDDRYGLSPLLRLVVQVIVPAVVALAVIDRSGWQLVVGIGLAVVFAAGYVNAFNFMDGINGISGSQAAIGGAFLAVVADQIDVSPLVAAGWVVCGASLGFLPYNVVRASIFLGDVGSYFLGFWLAGLALLLVDAGASAVVVVGPFLLYLLDTSSVLVRRARRGDRLTEAHREHTYQLLTQAGWSHLVVASLCAGISGVCALAMLAVVDSSTGRQVAALAACIALVGGYLALPNLLSGRHRPLDRVSA